MSYQEDRDEAENRFATSFERIAAALELIAQKMPWPITLNTQPFVPYQPLPATFFSSPNTSGTAVKPQAGAFQDLTEGRAIPVGTGGQP